MPLPTTTGAGQLVIDSIAWGVNQYGAWRIKNLGLLWQEAQQRGGDRILPSSSGVKAYRRRRTITERTVEVQIVGSVNGQTGATITNIQSGLFKNFDYLASFVTPTTGNGTRSAVLTDPDGGTHTKSVHLISFEIVDMDARHIFAELDLSIPSGTFRT